MLAKMRRRLTYSNVMITLLALVVLGGGTALAISGVMRGEGYVLFGRTELRVGSNPTHRGLLVMPGFGRLVEKDCTGTTSSFRYRNSTDRSVYLVIDDGREDALAFRAQPGDKRVISPNDAASQGDHVTLQLQAAGVATVDVTTIDGGDTPGIPDEVCRFRAQIVASR